jgi:hypothetical protein
MTYTLQTATQEFNHLTEGELDKLCESLVIQGYKLLDDDTNILEGGDYMGDDAPLAVYYKEVEHELIY